MKKSQWSEYEIIKLLQKLPEVEDSRSLPEVYQKVHTRSLGKRKRNKNWIPLLTVATAMFLMAVLGSSMFSDESSEKKSDSSQSISMDRTTEKQEDKSEDSGINESDEAPKDTAEKKAVESESTAVDEKETTQNTDDHASPAEANDSDQAADRTAVTIGVPDEQANYIIPITVSVEQNDSASLAQVLVEEMTKLEEEAWGLTNYYPMDVTISDGADTNQLIIDFPKDSTFSTLDVMFLAALQETLKYNQIERALFTTDGQPGVQFSHAGRLTSLTNSKFDKKAFLLYQLHDDTERFLVPSNISYDSINEALAALKEDPGHEGIHPSVPETIGWDTIREHNSTLEIDLSDDAVLEETEETRTALDAILFTAKDFGFDQVQFFNAPVKNIQELDLTEPLGIPTAPNKIK